MTCKFNLRTLPCDRLGLARTSQAIHKESTKIQLQAGGGSHFPQLDPDEYFYVKLKGCNSCCEVMKVIGVERDVLTVEREQGKQCECINANATVEYSIDNHRVYEDMMNHIPLTVTDPLVWNCENNTLSVDCTKLFSKGCGGCDCEDTDTGSSDGPSGSGVASGLRGEKGPKGDQGVGISSVAISPAGRLLITLSSGAVVDAGKLPTAKGTVGAEGPVGPRGEQGPEGEPGRGIQVARVNGDNLQITFDDGDVFDAGNVRGPQGDKGDQGDQGPKGDRGDRGLNASIVKAGEQYYIYYQPNTDLTFMSEDGSELGTTRTDKDGLGKWAITNPTPGLVKIMVGETLVGIGAT